MALRTPLTVSPHIYIGDSTGRPLDNGMVYFGQQDKDPEFYPIDIFSDDELATPVAQPIYTKGGYLYDKGDMVEVHATELIYSVKVLDSYGRKIFYKGRSMRNNLNDDVIFRIDEALIGATDAVNEALTAEILAAQIKLDDEIQVIKAHASQEVIDALDTAAVGAGGVSAQLVVDDGRTQKHINKLINFGYASVNDMLIDESISIEKAIHTNGYYAKGDSGGAQYDVITVAAADAANIVYWTAGDIKNHYGFALKNSLVAVISEQPEYTLEQFGGIGDNVFDCHDAFMVALSLYPRGVGYYQSTPTIRLNVGAKYYCSQLINLKRSVKIYCDGGGMASGSPAEVRFPAGCSAFIVNRYNTLSNIKQVTPTTGADSSTFEGFTIVGARGTADASGGHGIWLRARANIKNMNITNFEGNGIHVYAASNGGGDSIGNANNYNINVVRITKCSNGIYAKGYDANAGTTISADCSSNRRFGILDESFLGNQWIGCHTASNGGGSGAYVSYLGNYYQSVVTATEEQYANTVPGTDKLAWIEGVSPTSYSIPWIAGQVAGYYKSGGGYGVSGRNNRATFMGCYSEGGQGFTQGYAVHAIFIGGFLVETPVVGESAWQWGEFGTVKSIRGFRVEDYVKTPTIPKKGVKIDVGGDASNRNILTAEFDNISGTKWYLKGNDDYGLSLSYNNGIEVLRVLGVNNPVSVNPILSLPKRTEGGIGGTLASIETVTWTTASGSHTPTSGSYRVGSKVYTHRPVKSDYIGVICTVAGEAGSTAVFEKFGKVGAFSVP